MQQERQQERRHKSRRVTDREFDNDCRVWVKLKMEQEKRINRIKDTVKAGVIISIIISLMSTFTYFRFFD